MGTRENHSFFVIGLSHKTAPVEIRERFSFDTSSSGELIREIRAIEGVYGCVLISTCNRTELHAALDPEAGGAHDAIASRLFGSAGDGIEEHVYRLEGKKAAEHLFRVAGGLESMILGEPQILGQVKDAYSLACDARATCGALNRLFHHAFRTAKLIRNLTSIGEGTVSVSTAAVDLARNVLGGLDGRTVLLAGAGKIGELCARRLAEAGIARLLIANRTPSRAEELVSRLGGEAVPFEKIHELFATADIVITSVASRDPVILKETAAPYLALRGGDPLILIDLGVPRNVERSVAACGRIHLYDIDDLDDVTLGNRERRMLEADKAEALVADEIDSFFRRLGEHEVAPIIRGLHERFETIRRREIDRVRNRLDPETLDSLDLVTRRIVRKILHQPAVAMRLSVRGDTRDRMMEAVQELFIGTPEHGECDEPTDRSDSGK